MAVLNATLMIIFMKKIIDINWFFEILLLIKESFNLMWWEAQQAMPNQKVVVPGVTSPWWDDYLHVK